MKPESFDYPYAPIAEALRTLAIPLLIAVFLGFVGFGVWSVSKAGRTEYSIRESDLDTYVREEGSSVYLSQGASGPYKQGPGVAGPGVSLNVGGQSVVCEGVPGFRFYASSFINKQGKAKIVVWKLKDDQRLAQAQQE